MIPVINKRKCPAQEQVCKVIPVCPTQAIHYVADAKERLGGRIEIALDKCNGCGICVTECCGKAIEMQ
jgi:Pyruvate/2-oxoacid:ferredoxin oxidoreductase delta subunit